MKDDKNKPFCFISTNSEFKEINLGFYEDTDQKNSLKCSVLNDKENKFNNCQYYNQRYI